jgi:hypothetical protein
VLGVLFGVVLGLLLVHPVHTLSLSELVDLAADETSDELLRESVGDGLAYLQRNIRILLDKNLSIDNSQTYRSCARGPRRPSWHRRKRHRQRTRERICPRGAAHRCRLPGEPSQIRLISSQHHCSYYSDHIQSTEGVLQIMQARAEPVCMQAVRDNMMHIKGT